MCFRSQWWILSQVWSWKLYTQDILTKNGDRTIWRIQVLMNLNREKTVDKPKNSQQNLWGNGIYDWSRIHLCNKNMCIYKFLSCSCSSYSNCIFRRVDSHLLGQQIQSSQEKQKASTWYQHRPQFFNSVRVSLSLILYHWCCNLVEFWSSRNSFIKYLTYNCWGDRNHHISNSIWRFIGNYLQIETKKQNSSNTDILKLSKNVFFWLWFVESSNKT